MSMYYYRAGSGLGVKGLAVSKTGEVAAANFPQGDGLHIATTSGQYISINEDTYGGIQWDSKGNLYLGLVAKNANHIRPSGFAGDISYDIGVGSVVKFNPDSPFVWINPKYKWAEWTVSGGQKVYSRGLGGFSGATYCPCRSPRFEVDPYDRVLIPNALTSRVAIVDNNDNLIIEFGEWANIDSKGPQSLVPTNDIPLAYPTAVVSSDDNIYINDMVNARVVRVKKNYALDNMPYLSTSINNTNGSWGNRVGENVT
jgi:hypothetical protein